MKTDMRYILGCIRRADQDYHMIAPGDRILVGMSGGKDSLMLAHALSLYQQFNPDKFEVVVGTLDLGLKVLDFEALRQFCKVRNLPYWVEPTNIGEVVFETRKEKNPCALCAKMRRGHMSTLANKLGCNKVALGHQREDVMETFFFFFFHEGRINTFSPVTWLDRSDIVQIRPMVYVPAQRIISVAQRLDFPIQQAACTVAGETKREDMRRMIQQLGRGNKHAADLMFRAISHPQGYNLWDKVENRPADLPDSRPRPPLEQLLEGYQPRIDQFPISGADY